MQKSQTAKCYEAPLIGVLSICTDQIMTSSRISGFDTSESNEVFNKLEDFEW